MELTTISVSKDTKNKLAELGKKGDSFEDIILELIRKAKDVKKN